MTMLYRFESCHPHLVRRAPRRDCIAPATALSRVAVPLFWLANRQLFRHPLQVAMGYSRGRCHQGPPRGYLKIGHRREP